MSISSENYSPERFMQILMGTNKPLSIDDKVLKAIKHAISTLSPNESLVLKMRYGFYANCPHTLREIGINMGLTQERIRQIEAKAFRKLRQPARIRLIQTDLQINSF